ncbi:hypothetical protein [Pimelobacter simplex]|uniref:hypothetical protein n=1 Tax=Nocardioides simplex TaxID=2045 RepID=UPI0035B48C6A
MVDRRHHHPVPNRGHFASRNGTAPINASSATTSATGSRAKAAGRSTRTLHIRATV